MQREVNLPILLGGLVVVLGLVAGLWVYFMRSPGGQTADPAALERKSRELRQRRDTVAPPTDGPMPGR